MSEGLSNPSSSSPSPPGAGSKPSGMWQPPSLEEMQAMLPQYQFISLLGRGGMGAVYQAVQVSLDRPVAIKVLPGDLIDDVDSQFAERFKNEARTMARMNHPAIVNVFEFGETQTGLLFIVMEFIDGTDVSKMIISQGKLPPDYALAITAHVCDALAYAHKNGIIHRDIKPANILINMDGAVKVADFGLAKQSDAGAGGLTKTNMAMGTPDFVAPEALIPGIPLDGRADLYAIGVMLYQMLTGEIPRGMWTMPGIKFGTDPRFDAIIAKAMQTDREMRYQTAAEIRKDLDVIMTVPLVKAGDAHSRAAIPQQSLPPKRSADALIRQQPSAKLTDHAPPGTKAKKSNTNTGFYLSMAATVVALGVVAFLFSGKKPSAQTNVTVAAATNQKPAPPIKVAEPSKPPVIKAPPPKPSAMTPNPAKTAPDGSWAAWKGPNDTAASATWEFSGPEARTTQKSSLWSPESYTGDMEIELEWFVGPRGNGGLFYHVGGTNELEAPELQLADKANAGLTWSGGLFGILGATKELTKLNDWNTAKVVITGSKREHWINGERVCTYDVDSPGFASDLAKAKLPVKHDFKRRSGRLMLQANAGEVAYRNLKVRQLDVPAPTEPVASTTMPVSAPPPATSSTPPPAKDPLSIRLADVESKFQAALERDAGATYKAQIATLNKGYTAALDRELAVAAKAGKLDTAVALREEKQRVASGTNPPPEDSDTLPEALKKLRDTWRATEAGYAKARTTAAGPLFDAYDKALDAFQTELTKQNKIDEALRVKAVRDHVTTQRDSAAAPTPQPKAASPATAMTNPVGSGATAAAPQTPTAPPLSADQVLPPLPKATPEEIRELCEWCLNVTNSKVEVLEGGQRRTITSSTELPKGRFTLLTFYIPSMPMDAAGKKWFAVLTRVPELESIYVTNRIAGSFPVELLRGLTKLKSLIIAPQILNDAAFAHLTGLKSLERLIVRCEQFTGTGLGYINENLLEFTCESQTITAEGLAFLPRFKKLQRLELSRSGVTDAMLQGLAALPDLEELDLTSTKLDGSFLAQMPERSKLKRLDLAEVKTFKPEHLKHLAKLRNLEYLSLPPIDPGPEALVVIAGLDQLRELALINNAAFTGEGFKGLKGFKSLTRLGLHACPVNDAALEAVSTAMPGLTSLEMTNSENNKATITAEGLSRSLGRLKSLQAFNFYGERTTDDWMPHLAQLKGLTYLMLNPAKITDQGLAPLMKLPLGYLRLDGCPLITDAVIPVLKTCPTLGNVPVDNTQMTDAGKAELQRVLDAHRGK